MWRKWLCKFFKPQTLTNMSKQKDQIEVHGTKDGKLYIKPSDLFERENVQQLIQKIVNSPVIKRQSTKG